MVASAVGDEPTMKSPPGRTASTQLRIARVRTSSGKCSGVKIFMQRTTCGRAVEYDRRRPAPVADGDNVPIEVARFEANVEMRREGAEEIDARRPGRGGEIADGERAPRWVTLAQNLDDRIVEEAQTAVTGQL